MKKAADQPQVFTYAKSRFSHDAAHICSKVTRADIVTGHNVNTPMLYISVFTA